MIKLIKVAVCVVALASLGGASNDSITFNERIDIVKKYKNKLKECIVIIEGSDYKEVIAGDGITEQSQFCIGSISKQFTAILVLKALEKKNAGDIKKINEDLHRPLIELLKDTKLLHNLQNVSEKFKNRKTKDWLDHITLHDLLCHTSGIGNYSGKYFVKNFGLEAAFESKPYDHIELIQSAEFKKPQEKKHDYSNTNYLLLAKIVEQLTGEDFIDYLNDQIIKRLDLKNTIHPRSGNFEEAKEEYKISNLIINSYDILHEDLHNPMGAGGIISNGEDLIKWMKALHHDREFLNKDLYNLMISPHIEIDKKGDYYGYGIRLSNSKTLGKRIGHTGSIGLYENRAVYFPEKEIYLAILTAIPDTECRISYVLGEIE